MLEDVASTEVVEEVKAPEADVQPQEGVEAPENTEQKALNDEEKKRRKEERVQERINTQTRKYYEEKGRADALEAELNRVRQGQPGQPVVTSGDPVRESFQSDDEYNRAFIRFEAGKIAKQEVAQIEHTRRANVLKEKWANDRMSVVKEHDDFDEVVPEFIGSGIVTPTMDEAITETDRPAAITHYLATHQEEAQKLAALSPYRVAIEIGKIEAKLAPSRDNRKVSAAPAPIKPVGANSPGGGANDLEKMSPKDFAAKRNKEIAERQLQKR